MKRVEILLRENVNNLGRCGDIVSVPAGYARNFLFPQQMAIQATQENVKQMLRRRERLELEEAARAEEIRVKVEALAKVSLTTAEKADEGGRLFGSVNSGTIVKLLAAKSYPIDEKDVRLDHPIREVGTHQVPIHVHGDQSAEITLVVTAAS